MQYAYMYIYIISISIFKTDVANWWVADII